MTDEQNKPVRSRDEQVSILLQEFGGAFYSNGLRYMTNMKATDLLRAIAEAEARGAAEQRRKDAEGQEPVMWQKQFLDGTWSFTTCHTAHEANGTPTRPLYTHPANVAALEARVKVLEAVGREYLEAQDTIHEKGIFGASLDEFDKRDAARDALRAALTREGGE